MKSGGLAHKEKMAERLVGLDGAGNLLKEVAPGLLEEVKGAVKAAVEEANAQRGAAPPAVIEKHVHNVAEVHYVSQADVRKEVKAEIQRQFTKEVAQLREDVREQTVAEVKAGANEAVTKVRGEGPKNVLFRAFESEAPACPRSLQSRPRVRVQLFYL